MKKFILVSLGLVLFLFLIFILFLFSGHKQSSVFNPFSLPTPTPVRSSNSIPPVNANVTTVNPANQSDNVSTSATISLKLSSSISPDNIVFWSYPEFQYIKSLEGNNLVITPSSPLASGTNYGYAIKFPNGTLSPIYYFTTGKGEISQDNISQIENSWNKQFRPELFLASALPYSTNDFSASANYQEHYYFSVFLKGADQNAAKRAFLSWLASLGLTTTQINSLDITYYGGTM